MTSVFQGLTLSRSVGRVGENPGNEVAENADAGSFTLPFSIGLF